MKHYLVDIERGEYLSVGEFLTSQIEAESLTYNEIILQLKETDPSHSITKGFLSQITSDREKIPLGLIRPLIEIVLCEKQVRVRKYYISELLRLYLPSDLAGFVISHLQSLREDAEQEALNFANRRLKDWEENQGDDGPILWKEKKDDWFERAMGPELLDPIDFEYFENKKIQLNSFQSKRQKNKWKLSLAKIPTQKSEDGDFVVSEELIEWVEKSRIANEAAAKNRHSLFGHISRPRHGDCLANAIIRMQKNKPLYFQHKYTKDGHMVSDPVFLAACCETYCANGGNSSQFEKLLENYYEKNEQTSKGILFNPDEEPYIGTWKSNRLYQLETRKRLLRDHEAQRVLTIEDAKDATANAFNRHYFFMMDQFFEDNKRALFRLRYQKAKEHILKRLVHDWSTDNLLVIDLVERSTSTRLYQKLLSKDGKQQQQATDDIIKTWARYDSDADAEDEWYFWYSEEGPAPAEMREKLYYQRYSSTFFYFFEQQLFRLKNNVRQLKT